VKEQHSNISFRWKALATPLLLWGALVMVGYAHGGKHDGDEPLSPVTDTTGKTDETIAMFSASLDSAYAAVGATYSTVEPILKNSCYDCHSSQTDYPWYHAIPGIKQMIDDDIKEASEHMDLTNGFPFGGHHGQLESLHGIEEEVSKGEMPLFSYRMMHWGSKIEGDTQRKLFEWIEQSEQTIKEVYARYQMPLPKMDDDDEGGDSDHDADHAEDHDDDHDHGADEDGE